VIANLLGVNDRPAERLDLVPTCSDFCDRCGGCLHCFLPDPCGAVDGREHAWVVYPDQLAEFKIRYGLAGGSQ
jgi:hypothetical protein